jgi:hypothetical protein
MNHQGAVTDHYLEIARLENPFSIDSNEGQVASLDL